MVAEFASTASLGAVTLLSPSLRVQLGSGTLIDALVGSVALGLGFGFILVAFGTYTGAQGNPFVSLVATLYGGQPAGRTLRLVAGQVCGASVAASIIGTTFSRVVTPSDGYLPVHTVAEGVASFGMMLIGLGVAHRQDASVPVALGGMAVASVWMTGRGTLGNPVLSVAVLVLATHASLPDVARILGAQALGVFLAVGIASVVFPDARQSAGVLLFRPKS